MAEFAQPEDQCPAARPDPGPAHADALASRQRILEAAGVLEGDRRATMAEVAAAAGVGRSTLYRHFSSRAALAQALEALEAAPSPAARDNPPRSSWQVAPMPFRAPGQLEREAPLAQEGPEHPSLGDVKPHGSFQITRRRLLPGKRLILLTDCIINRPVEGGGTLGAEGVKQALEQSESQTAASTAEGNPANGDRLLARAARGRRDDRRCGIPVTRQDLMQGASNDTAT